MIVACASIILWMRPAGFGVDACFQDRTSPPRMHTKVLAILPLRRLTAGLFLFLLGLMTMGSVATAQPSFPGVPDGPSINLRVYPSDVWTPRVGPGIGVGLVGHGLVRPHDQWLLTAAPALHEQVATASFASANPQAATRYVLVGGRGLHTDADWLGPADRRTVLARSSAQLRLRAGQHLLNQRLLLQPHLALSHDRVDAVDRPGNGNPEFDEALPAANSRQTGLRIGMDVQFDARDAAPAPTRGLLLQGTWTRYAPLDGTDLSFDQVDLDASGYAPLGGRHRLALRLSTTLTRPRGDAPVPTYMLPTVGGTVVPGWSRGRFVAPDRLLASALYRFPLLHYERLAAIDGHVGAHLAGAYDRIGEQFAADVSFEDDVSLSSGDRPLRPSASVGLRFAMPRRDHVSLELAVGVSPEGVSAVRFSLTRALQALRPPHHTSANVR